MLLHFLKFYSFLAGILLVVVLNLLVIAYLGISAGWDIRNCISVVAVVIGGPFAGMLSPYQLASSIPTAATCAGVVGIMIGVHSWARESWTLGLRYIGFLVWFVMGWFLGVLANIT